MKCDLSSVNIIDNRVSAELIFEYKMCHILSRLPGKLFIHIKGYLVNLNIIINNLIQICLILLGF